MRWRAHSTHAGWSVSVCCMHSISRWTWATAILLTSLAALGAPQSMPADGVSKQLDRRGGGRVPFTPDAVALQMARGELGMPTAGRDGWETLTRADDGSYPVPGGAYAAFVVQADEPATMLLKASGHGMVYVNGEPRAGDPYGYGFVHLPVKLNAGKNLFLFQHGRGALRAELAELPAEVFFLEGDITAPDFLLGKDETLPLGAVVVNATDEPISAIPWTATGEEGEHARIEGAAMTVPAMSIRKVIFPVFYDGREGESLKVTLGFGEHEAARRQIDLAIRKPGQMYKRTFLSRIDGSVQYYAVQPRIPDVHEVATTAPASGAPNAAGYQKQSALVLSLHGASVEATNQANAYSPKTWCDIVCPTNRRPFGFDWEEWGRIDAIEVLDDAMRHLNSDPSRVYLTGHSMGGHGAWSIAAHYPDRFAAIGASAGWLSFGSYTNAGHPALFEKTEGVAGIFARATRAADTGLLLPNLRGKGIYILHGDADDNVPVREARDIAEKLRELAIAFEYHEQPGAGHWWENSDEPGAECVDWPAMFDMFARHRLPLRDELRTGEFITVNPGVSAFRRGMAIYQQIQPGLPSSVNLRVDPHQRRVVGMTDNVKLFELLSWGAPKAPQEAARSEEWTIELDGQAFRVTRGMQALMHAARPIHVSRDEDGTWRAATLQPEVPDGPPIPWEANSKQSTRSGPFKQAFDNRVVLIYGTKGTLEETAWARAKARYDAESFYYRGNGSIEVLADVDFSPLTANQSVILYGNADTHEDWTALLADCPIELRRGTMKVGNYFTHDGEDRGIVFCYPRPGSEKALVGVVSGTGLVGMKLTDRLPYFTSGVHYPDWTVFGPAVYEHGYEAADAAGYFDNAWKVDPANSAVRDPDVPIPAQSRPATRARSGG